MSTNQTKPIRKNSSIVVSLRQGSSKLHIGEEAFDGDQKSQKCLCYDVQIFVHFMFFSMILCRNLNCRCNQNEVSYRSIFQW